MRATPILVLLSAALLGGCVSVQTHKAATPAVTAAPIEQGPLPDDSLNATVWYQTSVERDLITREVYRAAGRYLEQALADPAWDALPREDRDNDPAGLPPAIIVDVDETVLDNSAHQARLIRGGGSFDEAGWDDWVRQRAAPALPGAAEFLAEAARRGVTVFYVSNRTVAQGPATVDNLRAAGFPIDSGAQFLGKGTVVEGCEGTGSDKGCRREQVGRRYRVLMQFGDQVGDFVDIPSNSRAGRAAAIAPYAGWIGERWWVLPNPVYGSWEPALFNNDWSLSERQRRAAKQAALDAKEH
ncbi:MAG TPA: HAD family acid phosphatase [Luteimonas sp.]|nr:HAD family acid phosphatase [Luteimonas sp.]